MSTSISAALRIFLAPVVFPLLMGGCETPAPSAKPDGLVPKRSVDGDLAEPARHPFLMLGSGPVYLVGRGLVAEAQLGAPGADPVRAYADDRRRTGEPRYVFLPEPFVLDELVTPSAASPKRRQLRGAVWRGEPFEEGVRIADGVAARIRRIVTTAAADGGVGFVVFGNARELFAVRGEERLQIRVVRGVLTEAEAAAIQAGTRLVLEAEPRVGETTRGALALDGATVPVEVQVLERYH